MPHTSHPRSRRRALLGTAAAAALCPLLACTTADASTTADATTTARAPKAAASVTLPPLHAGFDYQIGQPYTPPAGVGIVSRDHTASPATGLYNICYVNAFQAQPGTENEWGDLLLRDSKGKVVYDEDWGEAILDIRTADKRQRIADRVGTWIDSCATKGFKAVEPDNLDTFDRTSLISKANAKTFVKLLSDRAHGKGLAIGQKNTAELASAHKEMGLDFAVAEECGQYDECGDYAEAYDDHVVVIEYTKSGLDKACSKFGSRLSIVMRDVDVTAPGSSGYVRKTC
ncbi:MULTISPECIES: endo alpha-1,4 polygalactosaminidase [Streptomyces]|uniref:Endo alpha-1,4 polygalactosaminidase n=1 Tax=Streptomyces griseoaurantiacus TaxID=68213 RepID=A0A7W2DVS6_9ACTN|nr:endo alpha-1,4 polygalactosaminidase [Streptomyces griseoaurantiacus]MBA5223906.1 endo alpha-1,4 polygalactosaminidase [Streptomyces griseoaurantiacus]WTI30527.1 endo alpha-1,4 polygalactosaminidase [Streptomyces jietaisiensis]